MTDEVLKELWNIKDSIAKEHDYSIDGLANYYIKRQASRHGHFHQEKGKQKAEQKNPCAELNSEPRDSPEEKGDATL